MIELGRTEEVCREMDKLANKDHTHHATAEEMSVYRNNWWIRSNFVGSDTMPVRHRADFKEALSTLRRLKKQEDQALLPNLVAKLFLILVELARFLDPALIERGNLPNGDWANYSWNDSQH